MSFHGKFACGLMVAGALALGTTAVQAQMSGDKYVILVVTDLSSVYSDATGKGSVAGAEMAAEDFGGMVNGVPIEVIAIDNKLDVALSVNKTKEMIDNEGVDLVTDVVSSAAAIAVAKLDNERKVITTFVSPGSTQLTNEACGKYTWHYAWDTTAMAVAAARVTAEGAKKWYFITADYAFGHSLLEQFTKKVEANGGEVVGSDLVPFPNDDFSSYLLKAQAAGADVIGVLNSGQDLRNAVKQAGEFGLIQAGIKVVPGQLNVFDINSLGVDAWKDVIAGEIWYWNYDAETRAWAERFKERMGFWPGSLHAGNYSAVSQVLKAVDEIGTDDPDKVTAALEGKQFEDFFARNATWRARDHRVVRDMYVVQVKDASDITEPDDFYTVIATVPGDQVFLTEAESTCNHDW